VKLAGRTIGLYIAIAIAALLLAIVTIVALQVEDWRRDLTTNHAETAQDAEDSRLRPIESELPPAELAAQVSAATAGLPNWRLESRQENGESIELHFVRTTRLLRFVDDIRVRIAPTAGGSRLTAESRSRVGKGDLGQNPRNLRELLGAVRGSRKP
jgi:uncharacterized protein (DUF1499 family)